MERIKQLLPLLILVACSEANSNQPAPAIEPADFDGSRAFKDLKYLVEEIGPRRIGTQGAAETRQYIQEQLEGHGWTIEEDPFTCTPPEEARRKGEIVGVNLIARRAGNVAGEIWLTSHYDTYDMPGFVGANDAGSSTAVLIELARQLGGDGPRDGMDLVLVWFDGEERFPPAEWDDRTNSTFGSRHLADKLLKEIKPDGERKITDIKAFILLDLVGDEKLGLTIESRSAGWLGTIFRRTASGLGHKQLFVGSQTIKDNHQAFWRHGVQVIDLIDFNYGVGNEYWHTRQDTLDKCSQESLETVGTLVLSALPEIQRVSLKRDADRQSER